MDSQALEAARAAFDRGEWSVAYARFASLDGRSPLEPDDLDRLASAAYLVGEDAASDQARTRAHARFLEQGDAISAARSAFWLAFALADRPGQQAQVAGWLARAQRLLDDVKDPCVERGWLLCASARQRAAEGDLVAAHARFTEAAQVAVRFGDRDLLALARHGEGRALLMMNQASAGLTLIDEVMVAVTGGEVGPMVAGVVYCSVISACHSLFDLRRAQEWTEALQGWCASHPDLVPFRGYCLVRRSELMQLHGAWHDALNEAQRACEQPGPRAAGRGRSRVVPAGRAASRAWRARRGGGGVSARQPGRVHAAAGARAAPVEPGTGGRRRGGGSSGAERDARPSGAHPAAARRGRDPAGTERRRRRGRRLRRARPARRAARRTVPARRLRAGVRRRGSRGSAPPRRSRIAALGRRGVAGTRRTVRARPCPGADRPRLPAARRPRGRAAGARRRPRRVRDARRRASDRLGRGD